MATGLVFPPSSDTAWRAPWADPDVTEITVPRRVRIHLRSLDGDLDRTLLLTKDQPSVDLARASNNPVRQTKAGVDNAFIDSRIVSKPHCQLYVDLSPDWAVYVKDLASSHGTFLNDRKVPTDKGTRVYTGDRVKLSVPVVHGSDTYYPKSFEIRLVWEDSIAEPSSIPTPEDSPKAPKNAKTFSVPNDSDSDIGASRFKQPDRSKLAPKRQPSTSPSRPANISRPVRVPKSVEPGGSRKPLSVPSDSDSDSDSDLIAPHEIDLVGASGPENDRPPAAPPAKPQEPEALDVPIAKPMTNPYSSEREDNTVELPRDQDAAVQQATSEPLPKDVQPSDEGSHGLSPDYSPHFENDALVLQDGQQQPPLAGISQYSQFAQYASGINSEDDLVSYEDQNANPKNDPHRPYGDDLEEDEVQQWDYPSSQSRAQSVSSALSMAGSDSLNTNSRFREGEDEDDNQSHGPGPHISSDQSAHDEDSDYEPVDSNNLELEYDDEAFVSAEKDVEYVAAANVPVDTTRQNFEIRIPPVEDNIENQAAKAYSPNGGRPVLHQLRRMREISNRLTHATRSSAHTLRGVNPLGPHISPQMAISAALANPPHIPITYSCPSAFANMAGSHQASQSQLPGWGDSSSHPAPVWVTQSDAAEAGRVPTTNLRRVSIHDLMNSSRAESHDADHASINTFAAVRGASPASARSLLPEQGGSWSTGSCVPFSFPEGVPCPDSRPYFPTFDHDNVDIVRPEDLTRQPAPGFDSVEWGDPKRSSARESAFGVSTAPASASRPADPSTKNQVVVDLPSCIVESSSDKAIHHIDQEDIGEKNNGQGDVTELLPVDTEDDDRDVDFDTAWRRLGRTQSPTNDLAGQHPDEPPQKKRRLSNDGRSELRSTENVDDDCIRADRSSSEAIALRDELVETAIHPGPSQHLHSTKDLLRSSRDPSEQSMLPVPPPAEHAAATVSFERWPSVEVIGVRSHPQPQPRPRPRDIIDDVPEVIGLTAPAIPSEGAPPATMSARNASPSSAPATPSSARRASTPSTLVPTAAAQAAATRRDRAVGARRRPWRSFFTGALAGAATVIGAAAALLASVPEEVRQEALREL